MAIGKPLTELLSALKYDFWDHTLIENALTHSSYSNEYKAKGLTLPSNESLYFIESGIRPARSSTALLGFSSYSLEHLLPKKWRNNWDACATQELARQRDSILLTLGNLAIIPQSLNASIRDGNWATKKAGKGPNNPGLAICAAGLSTIHDALQKDVWNEDEISQRAIWLYEQAKSLWEL